MEWFLLPYKRIGDFSGRSRRKEYWMFILINIFLVISFAFIFDLIGLSDYFRFYLLIQALFFVIPMLSLWIRRLHDINKSGAYLFVRFIPLIGGIWFLILMCTEGDSGPNKYGPDPKNPISELDDIGVTTE